MSEQQLTSALNLMRRMPPNSIENSLAGLIELIPDLTDDLLNHIDQPLKIKMDTKTQREFILCDYNRDGDSYRSPWSNLYFPKLDDGFTPNQKLRNMEIEANKIFDIYRKQYFEGGFSSVYFFETDQNQSASANPSFGACFLIHKDVLKEKGLDKGWWDSIHVFEVIPIDKKQYHYKLTTTVMVSLGLSDLQKFGQIDLSGSMTKQDERKLPLDENNSHLANLGTMLEDMELKLRNAIEGIYIQKTREVLNGMRSTTQGMERKFQDVRNEFLNAATTK